MSQILLNGKYLGGHAGRVKETAALLRLSDEGVRVKPGIGRAFIEEPWSSITELAAEGPDQIASRFTATRLLLTGPLALAFKKKQKLGYVVIRGEFGEFLFEVKTTPQELRAKMAPWQQRIPQPAAESPAVSRAPDKIGQLQALADLRDRDALTNEEFAAQKAVLLGESAAD
jgi:hypothetical protein